MESERGKGAGWGRGGKRRKTRAEGPDRHLLFWDWAGITCSMFHPSRALATYTIAEAERVRVDRIKTNDLKTQLSCNRSYVREQFNFFFSTAWATLRSASQLFVNRQHEPSERAEIE